jgi:hypothetical protein
VNIGTCSPLEADLVRARLAAHDLAVTIRREPGPDSEAPATATSRFEIWVDDDAADKAGEALAELRAESSSLVARGEEAIVPRPASDTTVGTSVTLALTVGFGSAHMYTGSPVRGTMLAAAQGIGLVYWVAGGTLLGAAFAAGAIVTDLIGGVVRARRINAPIPSAVRIRR